MEVSADAITVPRLPPAPPTAAAAEELGRRLARTHVSGAPAFGAPPAGWDGDGFIGTAPLPHRRPGQEPLAWGAFYGRYRLLPFLRTARDAGALPTAGVRAVEAVVTRCEDGAWDDGRPPSRLHGDLWSGNVLWTASPRGTTAALVDPAAHGGHAETDLAMLALFGLPHLDRVLAAYDEAAPLPPGWRARVPLHQVHPLLVHAVLFGGGYGDAAARAARAALSA